MLIALALRVFQLGHDGLWGDEAGVAGIAALPSLRQAIATSRQHVMAMPLDYVVLWSVARFSLSEWALRLPAALWSTLAIGVCYRLFVAIVAQRAALISALLLALTPILVHYAQEVRFYALLMLCFWLSLWLLYRALRRNRTRDWAIWTIVTLIGVYAHVYVALTPITGVLWWAWSVRRGRLRGRWLALLTGSLLIGAVAAISVAQRRSTIGAFQPLFVYSSLLEGVMQSMGWQMLDYGAQPWWTAVWGALCAGLALLGLIVMIRDRLPWLPELVLTAVIQIALIVASDWISGYWFAARQLIHLTPIAMLLSGIGAAAIIRWLRPRLPAASVIVTGMLIVTAIPALSSYYRWTKSTAREVNAAIVGMWQPGDRLLVAPAWTSTQRYYLGMVNRRPDLVDRIEPMARTPLAATLDATHSASRVFLDLLGPLSEDEQRLLIEAGFRPLRADQPSEPVELLYIRERAASP